MKKNVRIIGIGQRMQGKGKNSGREYDFTPVSFEYDDEGFAGKKAETVNIGSDVLPAEGLKPGDECTFWMHTANFRTYVDVIM